MTLFKRKYDENSLWEAIHDQRDEIESLREERKYRDKLLTKAYSDIAYLKKENIRLKEELDKK